MLSLGRWPGLATLWENSSNINLDVFCTMAALLRSVATHGMWSRLRTLICNHAHPHVL